MKSNLIFILFIFLFLNNCSSFKEAGEFIRNERKVTTDEFLIKKRQPLTIPPDLDKVPEPGSLKENSNQQVNDNEIKTILGAINENNEQISSEETTTEKSLLDKIKR